MMTNDVLGFLWHHQSHPFIRHQTGSRQAAQSTIGNKRYQQKRWPNIQANLPRYCRCVSTWLKKAVAHKTTFRRKVVLNIFKKRVTQAASIGQKLLTVATVKPMEQTLKSKAFTLSAKLRRESPYLLPSKAPAG